jgi:nucleoid-associated protein YgaU
MARSRYFSNQIVAGKYVPWVNRSVDANDTHDIMDDVSFVEHTFAAGERLDTISARYLGDDKYYWVIALVNEIACPLDVAPGTVLRIPNDVQQVLRKLFP